MTTSIDRPIRTDDPPPARRRWALALTAFAVAVAAVVITVITIGGGEEDTATSPVDKVEDFATHFRTGDLDALVAAAVPGSANEPFAQWIIGLRAEPSFTDCRVTGETINATTLSCDVTYRTDSFFGKLFGPGPFPFGAQVTPEGLLAVTSWPPPPGLSETAGELRTYFEAEHPELVDTVFGTGYAGLAWSRAGGEALDQHVDGFIAYRAGG